MNSQNILQAFPQQTITENVYISILHQLQQENYLLKLELNKCKQENVELSIQVSKYADMVLQLHSEIDRLSNENNDLRAEIKQLKIRMKIYEEQRESDQNLLAQHEKKMKIYEKQKEQHEKKMKIYEEQRESDQKLFTLYGNQLQMLMSSHERKRKFNIRQLMYHIKADENLMNQLSPDAQKLIVSLKNKVNSAADNLFPDLIKEAIRSENKPELKMHFIEMYCLVFGEYEEESECDDSW